MQVRTRSGSKRGRTYEAFKSGGVNAAWKVAEKLGVRESRFKRWVRGFNGEDLKKKRKEVPPPPPPKKELDTKKLKRVRRQSTEIEPTPFKDLKVGQTICLTYRPGLRAKLIGVGPEQCGYKNTNGREIFVSTKNVVVVEDNDDD